MPIYEYEPCDRECLMCNGRVEVIQGVKDEPLKYCPYCGLEVRRVISAVNFQLSKKVDIDKAARKGMTTFKRSGLHRWEKMAGEGPSVIERTPNPDIERISATEGQELVTDSDE